MGNLVVDGTNRIFVMLAGFFRSASAFLNLFMGTLKIVADYYPGRLHRAFVIDPPSLFSVMWKVTNHTTHHIPRDHQSHHGASSCAWQVEFT